MVSEAETITQAEQTILYVTTTDVPIVKTDCYARSEHGRSKRRLREYESGFPYREENSTITHPLNYQCHQVCYCRPKRRPRGYEYGSLCQTVTLTPADVETGLVTSEAETNREKGSLT